MSSFVTRHKDECFTVDNFLSDFECKAIIAYLDFLVANKILEWNQISFYDSFAMGFWPYDPNLEMFGLPSNYFNDILKKRIHEKFDGYINRFTSCWQDRPVFRTSFV